TPLPGHERAPCRHRRRAACQCRSREPRDRAASPRRRSVANRRDAHRWRALRVGEVPGVVGRPRRRLRRLISSVMVLLAGLSVGSAVSAGAATFDHEHRAWTQLLEKYVKDGRVDYAGLHGDARPALAGYLGTLSAVTRAGYAEWTRAQRLAFWINAYNAYTI